jgi:Zn-dependent protease
MLELSIPQKVAIWALPVLFAITVHEVAHGWMASKFGDQTARLSGRLTLNPLKHIDLIGTIIVPLALLLLPGGIIFGWAKPVPVDARNLHHPKRDMAIVAAAGPCVNLLMALIWAGIAKLGLFWSGSNPWLGVPIFYMGEAGIMINVVLAVLNFLPIPPLDGGRIVANLLPNKWAWYLMRMEPYSFFILILLVVSGVLSAIISPPIVMLIEGISRLYGL